MEQAALQLAQYNASLAEQRIQLSSTQSSMAEIRLRAGAWKTASNRPGSAWLPPRKRLPSEGMLAEAEQAVSGRENAVRGYEMRLEGRRKRANAAREAWNQLTLDVGEQQRVPNCWRIWSATWKALPKA